MDGVEAPPIAPRGAQGLISVLGAVRDKVPCDVALPTERQTGLFLGGVMSLAHSHSPYIGLGRVMESRGADGAKSQNS